MKNTVIRLAILAAISMLLVAGAANAAQIAYYDGTVTYDSGSDMYLLNDQIGTTFS